MEKDEEGVVSGRVQVERKVVVLEREEVGRRVEMGEEAMVGGAVAALWRGGWGVSGVDELEAVGVM